MRIRTFIKVMPSALFLLVPIFALTLKLAYVGSGWRYLDHLVVAIYSHVFLCVVLLAMLVMTGLAYAVAPNWAAFPWIGELIGLLWIWVPIYLLLMQKRVYSHRWPPTLARFVVIGSLYSLLLAFTATMLATIGLLTI